LAQKASINITPEACKTNIHTDDGNRFAGLFFLEIIKKLPLADQWLRVKEFLVGKGHLSK